MTEQRPAPRRPMGLLNGSVGLMVANHLGVAGRSAGNMGPDDSSFVDRHTVVRKAEDGR